MIYITGDTHGNIDFQRLKNYFEKRYVTRNDYLLILGDVAVVWSEAENYIKEYDSLGPTILYIDGNHENFELLNLYQIVEYKGAKCHRITENIYHILRGEILNINGLSFFCMGGATSTDKQLRANRINWWEEENITNNDIDNGLKNLEKVNNHVDYVLTHVAPSSIVKKMFGYKIDSNTEILEKFKSIIDFNHWYFGHYHKNQQDEKYRCFYEDILEIPAMYEGTGKKVDGFLYAREDPHVPYEKDPYLINEETGEKISIKAEDFPEWYYHGHYDRYYCLKGVTDIAFLGFFDDKYISKFSNIFLHYHGQFKKDEYFEPFIEDEWDSMVWGCSIVDFCLGLEKYSPHLDLRPLKARINLVYDQYNNGKNNDVVVRPFPEVETPHFDGRFHEKEAEFVVLKGKEILSEFLYLDNAFNYVKKYILQKLSNNHYEDIVGVKTSDYIAAVVCGNDRSNWIFIKKIESSE